VVVAVLVVLVVVADLGALAGGFKVVWVFEDLGISIVLSVVLGLLAGAELITVAGPVDATVADDDDDDKDGGTATLLATLPPDRSRLLKFKLLLLLLTVVVEVIEAGLVEAIPAEEFDRLLVK
jgi:hypothetical protein